MALEFPELRIVGGHIGHPWTQEMISLLTRCENVFVDTSALYAVLDADDELGGNNRQLSVLAQKFREVPRLPSQKGAERVLGLPEDGFETGDTTGWGATQP